MLKHNLRGMRWRAGVLAVVVVAAAVGGEKAAEEAAAEARLRETVAYLASDELEGRGLGTKGIDLAADYIAAQFTKLGLKTDLVDGKPFQVFPINLSTEDGRLQVNWKVILGKTKKPATESADSDQAAGPPKTVGVARNVLAVLEGEGPRADEAVLIGAHYDHLGKHPGQDGKLSIYNGANDNASGVATMLEVARILATRSKKLPRRVVFAAFSAEERGMVGSFYYVNHPLVPLEKTVAMINLDMVGCPKGDALAAAGRQSSPMFAELANRIGKEHHLTLAELPSKLTGSDHLPFYGEQIPSLHFMTTGGFADYHRPSDDSDKLDYGWMERVASMVADLTVAMAEASERPTFVEDKVSDVLTRGAVHFWGSITSPKPRAKRAPPKVDHAEN